jgi:hypothetical protein
MFLDTVYVPPRKNTTLPGSALPIALHMLQGVATEHVVPVPVGDTNNFPLVNGDGLNVCGPNAPADTNVDVISSKTNNNLFIHFLCMIKAAE